MRRINVGIGDLAVSDNIEDELATHALGSCVAVLAYDWFKRIAGVIHIALPNSSINREKAERKPGYFADTGIALFLKELFKTGTIKNKMWLKITGGSNIMDESGTFDIGKRNSLAVKKILWKNQLGPIAEDIGGNQSRTVMISVATGEITVKSGEKTWHL